MALFFVIFIKIRNHSFLFIVLFYYTIHILSIFIFNFFAFFVDFISFFVFYYVFYQTKVDSARITKCINRMFSCCFPCRIQSEHHTDQSRKSDRKQCHLR